MAPAASFSGKLIFVCDSLCSLSPDSEVTVCPAASTVCWTEINVFRVKFYINIAKSWIVFHICCSFRCQRLISSSVLVSVFPVVSVME